MAFKLLENAQARWRRVNGYELVAVVRAGGVLSTASCRNAWTRNHTRTPPEISKILVHNS